MAKFEEKKIIELLGKSRKGALSLSVLAKRLGLKKREKAALKRFLAELEKRGKIVKISPKKYSLPDRVKLLTGYVERFRDGFGFFIREGEPDIFISPRHMRGALTGDKVLLKVIKEKEGKKPEGVVLKVIERQKAEFIGTYQGARRFGYIVPDDVSLPPEIPVGKGDTEGAKPGDKVVFKLVGRGKNLRAKVIEVLGRADDPAIDLLIVLRKYGLPTIFPEDVEKEAQRLPSGISRRALRGRLDLRNELIFTIDPETAKDFDDAISVRKLDEGIYELGVHIADVSYYVREDTFLDDEARNRGTSVYLLDYVVPMLPHRISGDLASLRPGEDRLTMSVIMRIDPEGNVVKRKVRKSIINSAARLTYVDAQRILDGEEPESPETSFRNEEVKRKVKETLAVALELARILRQKRWERGSLDFDLPEPEILLLPGGEVAHIKPTERLWAHRIIEEFMIKANEEIAAFLVERDVPTIFRIHEPPDPQKIAEFLALAEGILGTELPKAEGVRPKDLQKILEMVKGREEEPILNYLLLRSLMRARYSVENVGHFGLASPLYLHFTSPIRRYPDLVVHRNVKSVFSRKIRRDDEWIKYLEETASLATTREERAEKAEFELIDLKKLEFMKDKIGEEFKGIITHITSYGFFVEITEYLTEGFVSVEVLGKPFRHIKERYALVSEDGVEEYRLGQKVIVKVLRVDKSLKRLDLAIVRS